MEVWLLAPWPGCFGADSFLYSLYRSRGVVIGHLGGPAADGAQALGLGRSPCWPSDGREPDRSDVRCGVDPIRPALAVLEDLQFWKNGIASSEDLALAVMPLLDGVELLVQLAMQIFEQWTGVTPGAATGRRVRQTCFSRISPGPAWIALASSRPSVA